VDSRSILLATGEALWLMNPNARPSQPMTRILDGVFSNLSTDAAGLRYAFNRTVTDANIWQFDVPSQRASQLIASSEEDSEPHFSPDGSRILFRSRRTGQYELYVCNRDGSGVRQLTHQASHCGSARWSPDGKWIAYDSVQDVPGQAGTRKFDNIYVMAAEGGPARRLTDDQAGSVVPNWSADSRWVYYSRDRYGPGSGATQSWKSPVEGGESVPVDSREMWQAVESADGRWIFYEQPTTGKGLWRRPVAGGDGERIPATENLTYRTWEIRRDFLVFLRSAPDAGFYRQNFRPGTSPALRRVGPPPKRLLHGPATMSVSPDGRTILYTSEDLTFGDIYVLTAGSLRD
jgi:dipeptidyl aminopeptidase/acylaminoacyl peptidase